MQNSKPLNIKQLITLIGLLFYSAITPAYYFAYIPDEATDEVSKYLHVVNTSLNLYVDKILLSGTPRDVVLNHRGDYVFVSGVITEGSVSVSKINVINTAANENTIALTLTAKFVRGLTISSDDTALYVTHETGITRIYQPTYAYEQTPLDLTYRGTTVILSDNDQYLFVIGTDGNNTDGISVVDVSQQDMFEVATYSLGTDVGANAIEFDEVANELFIVTTSNHPTDTTKGGQLIKLRVGTSATGDLELSPLDSLVFPFNSFPVDLALNPDKTEVYVVLSYVSNTNRGLGFGNGYISIIDSTDFTKPAIRNLTLSAQGGNFSSPNGDGAIHPSAVSFDDSGKLHVVKQLWNAYTGTYVSSFDDFISSRTGIRSIIEGPAVNLGKRSSSQLTGKFVGANCTNCPDGLEDPIQVMTRPSAINPFLLLSALLILVCFRFRAFIKRPLK